MQGPPDKVKYGCEATTKLVGIKFMFRDVYILFRATHYKLWSFNDHSGIIAMREARDD